MQHIITQPALSMIALSLAVLGCALGNGGDPSRYRQLLDTPPTTTLTVPVAGIRRTQLRDTWGAARSGGRTHEGIDIPAKRGTPVISATDGVVSRIGERNLGGQTVNVTGPGGYSHYYAHLDSYADKKVGQWVRAGDTLGFVGTTGNAQGTSPHLHYGIYTDTGAINPYPLLVKSSGTTAKGTATPGSARTKSGTKPQSGTKSGTMKTTTTRKGRVAPRNTDSAARTGGAETRTPGSRRQARR